MSYTYATFTTNLALEMGDPQLTGDANFQTIVNGTIIPNAEARICSDLDFLGAVVTSTTLLTAGNRNLNWSNAFFVVQSLSVITPQSTTNPDLGTRNPVLPATKDLCTYMFPSVTASGVPQFFGRVTQDSCVLGPWPDQAYTVEITGTQRPASLSSTNATTFISVYLPQLFMAASMVEASGYMQNFSAVGDNPAQGVNWSQHYANLLKSGAIEEARKKFQAEGWSSSQPTGISTPPRT
jgi:hypothetical protein